MDYSSAKCLLDKYFEGETSLVEERQLRAYFTNEVVAPDLQEYAPLFGAFSKARQVTYDEPIALPAKRFPLKYIASIAAGVVIAVGVWMQSTQGNSTTVSTNYASEEIAILKTKQALGVMSQMITKSTTQLEVVNEYNKASSTLFK